MFILKVVINGDIIEPYTTSHNGGTEFIQIMAFNHIIPDGWIHWEKRDLLQQMCNIHNWELEYIKE